MNIEKQDPITQKVSGSSPEKNRLEGKEPGARDNEEVKSSDLNRKKKSVTSQREQEFKILQIKHKHKSELDALKKALRQKDEEIENLKKWIATQEEQNLAYKNETERQKKFLKDSELEFEKRLNQLKTNLENIHLQELKEKVNRARKEEQQAARRNVEELQEKIETAKRAQKNQKKDNEGEYQVTLLQLKVDELQTQIKELQTQIKELKHSKAGDEEANEALRRMNESLMEKVSSSNKKVEDVEGSMEQVVSSKMEFVERTTAEIGRLHQELTISRKELTRVRSELVSSQRQVAAQAIQIAKISMSTSGEHLSHEKKNTRAGKKKLVPDPIKIDKRSSRPRVRSVTSPRSKLEKKNQRNGRKSPRSEQISTEKKQQRNRIKSAKLEQLGYEKKQQSAERKHFGSENLSNAKLDMKKLRTSRKSPCSPRSPRMKQPIRRRSTGMSYTSLENQLRAQNADHLLRGKWVKNENKIPKTPPKTEHISVKNNQNRAIRSKTNSNSENTKRKQVRRRASQPKTKISDAKLPLLKPLQSAEGKYSKRSGIHGYEINTSEEPRPFGISRAVRSKSTENHNWRIQCQSIQFHPTELEKRRRSSRK